MKRSTFKTVACKNINCNGYILTTFHKVDLGNAWLLNRVC